VAITDFVKEMIYPRKEFGVLEETLCQRAVQGST